MIQNGRHAELLHASNMHDRIRELREARGWSMRELAQRTNSSASTINSLEKGKTQMTMPWLERLAKVFDVSMQELVGLSPDYVEPEEDVVRLPEGSPESEHINLRPNQVLYKVQTSVVDQLGIFAGSIVIVSMSPVAIRSLRTGDVVVGQHSDGIRESMLVRQFIEPSMLITNSGTRNRPSINLRNESFRIDGLVVSSVSHFRERADAIVAA